ncbi:MAG: YbaY family lipoprotein [Planctomycetaceae bacterium]
MKIQLYLTATLVGSALLAATTAFAIDPARSPSGTSSIPATQNPYSPQYGPGFSTIPNTANPGLVIPGGTSINGTYFDDRGRPIQTISAVPTYTQPGVTPAVLPGTNGDFSSVNTTNRISPQVLPGTGTATGTQQQSRWRLGVYSKDTDTGVRIIQVVNGSAAQKAGLEANDVIVTVAGYQVGYVGGVPYDCANEFERHADAEGWVSVLVQNNRDGKLLNLPVKLDSRFSSIDGNIVYRENYSLPRTAVVNVELRETIRQGAPPVTLARRTITDVTTVPIPFRLDYDPSLVDRNRIYQLYATITSGNQTLFETRQNIPVIADGRTTNVSVLVESTAVSQPGQQYLSRDQQMEQVVQWFRTYLRRDPRPLELYVWQSHIDRGGSLNEARVQILSNAEFYNRSDSNDVRFIQQLHELILGQPASQAELSYWMGRMEFHHRLRPEVVREFLGAVGQAR